MAEGKKVYGHINCPHCGYEKGMRITADKHGEPFGFCEANCDGQLRIGGKPRRVAEFFKNHPDIAAAMQQKAPKTPVTVTEPEKPAPAVTEPPPPAKPEPKKSTFNMGL